MIFDWGGEIGLVYSLERKDVNVFVDNIVIQGTNKGVQIVGGDGHSIQLSWEGWDKIAYAMNKVKIAQGEKE